MVLEVLVLNLLMKTFENTQSVTQFEEYYKKPWATNSIEESLKVILFTMLRHIYLDVRENLVDRAGREVQGFLRLHRN